MINSRVAITGSYLPRNIVKNKELEKIVNTDDTWIRERTGIEQRHLVAPGEDSLKLATNAVKDILDKDPKALDNIDMILFATCTPGKLMPSSACRLQAELNLKNIPALDINAACSGFLYALASADAYIKSGLASRVLVVGAETLSSIIDWEDRSTCVLFGDGAGAVIMESSQEQGIIAADFGADGSYSNILNTKGNILSAAEPSFIQMEGKEVYKKAVTKMADISSSVLSNNNLTPNDIDWFVPHQANKRIIDSCAKSLGLPEDKIIVTLDKHANTSAASIPLALDHGIKSGSIKRGDLILSSAFGAGLTWGSILLRY